MGRYIRYAFWLRPSIPLLGALPLNLMLFSGLLILGLAEFIRLGHAGFWLLALGLEVAYLFFLSNNSAFQAWVDSQDREARNAWEQQQVLAKRQLLLKRLSKNNNQRFNRLQRKIEKIRALEIDNNVESYLSDTNYEALQKLLWMALKLLTAEENMQNPTLLQQADEVRAQLQQLEQNIQDETLAAITHDSMQATIALLQKRLRNNERREQALKRVKSDLTHIETQIDLALENATIDGQPHMASDQIEMVSNFLQEMQNEFYGQSQQDIEDLDKLFK